MNSQFLVFILLFSPYLYLLIQQCVFRTHQAQHYTSPTLSPSHPRLPFLFFLFSHSGEGTTTHPLRSRTGPLGPLSSCPARAQRYPYTPCTSHRRPARDAPPSRAPRRSGPTPSEHHPPILGRAAGPSCPLGEAFPPRPFRAARSARTRSNSGSGGKEVRSTLHVSAAFLP